MAVFLISALVLSLAIAAPKVTKSLQRDHDLETYHRGLQYRRAIQLYYRKFHAYPPNVDALVNTNEIRFLRKKYSDPTTGKDDWKPVLFGQNKAPTAMGFFGQPLAGGATSIAGIGPSGGNGMPGAMNPGGSAFGGSSGSLFSSSSNNSNTSGSGSATTSGSTDNSGGTNTNGTTGNTSSTSSSTTGSGSGPGSSSGLSGQTFGGAGIIGFSPASTKQSILVYKKKNHYNEWEFTYDPLSDMQTMGGGNTGAIGQPASSTTNPVGSSPFGNTGFGSTSFGNSGSSGNNPTPVASPPASTQ